MRRVLLVCAAITFAIACTDNITEPTPDRSPVAGGSASRAPTVAFATTTTDDGLSISTDKDDYQPGDVVHFTGYGWQAGDVLDIVLTDDPLTHDPLTWTVEVGADGMFQDQTYVVDEGDLNVTFTLVATSRATGRSLTVIFTDNIVGTSVTLNNLVAVTVAPGATIIAAVTTRVTSQNPQNSPVTWQSTGWVLQANPATATPAGKLANCVDTPNITGTANQGTEATATFNTTAPATPGSYDLWLALSDQDGTGVLACGGGGQSVKLRFAGVVTVPPPNLSMDKSHVGDFTRGTNGVYTLVVANSSSPTTSDVIVRDTLPAGLTFISGTGTDWTNCTASGQVVTCVRPAAFPIVVGTPAPAITMTVAVGSGTASSITNRARVSGGGEPASNLIACGVTNNNCDADATNVGNQPVDLTVSKSHADAFTHGANGVFSITARNDGGTATSGTATVSDELPTGFGYVSAVGTGWTCGASAAPVTVTCTRTAAIEPQTDAPSITLTGSVTAAAGTILSNTASVSGGGEPAANNGNNLDTDEVTVGAPPNAAPVAHDDAASTNEDFNVNIDVLANDTDDGPPASLVVVTFTQPGSGQGSVTLGADNRTITYSPAPNFFGEATFTYKASDGAKESAAATVTVTVNPVNDAPTFTKGTDPVTVLEDAAAQSVSWATNIKAGPNNESTQALTFSLTNDNNGLFSVQPALSPAGILTYTPASNAFGSAIVTVRLEDDGGTANGGVNYSEQTFTLTVTPVNDAPSFTKGADETVNEDAGAQSVPGWATNISAGPNESGQVVTFVVSSNNPLLFSSAPSVASNGTLTYTPASDENGSAIVTIKATDDGGTLNGGINQSAEQTFTITVRSVNDAPTFTAAAIPSVSEGSAQTVTGWITSKSAGPANEAGQVLTFTITADASRFTATGYPTLDAAGNLTYHAKSTPNTAIPLTLKLSDDGGTANGGVDFSTQQFQIQVNNVAPSALAVTLPSGPVPISNAAQITIGFTDPGPEDVHNVTVNWGDLTAPSSQTLTVGARSTQRSHNYAQPGVYSVTVTVADTDGGSISDTFEYIVIYDPEGGFVTGGGTIYSPAGAYKPSPASEGRANFGFVSKYVKNNSLPIGSTEFQFQAGDLNFKSTSYEWLIVSGSKGQYRGFGSINGGGNYRFVLTVDDGAPDKFRIRIWSGVSSDDGTGSLVYDNQLADPTDAFANAKTAIATGSIVVHAPNGKTAMK